ncbi:choice-of-anchor D domain-containing protein [Halobaculum litoreum]|uniref:Choice-of-anchor D domain-containing protein n=1 Tax=Halobaculum litoreum TaxID=3031998 RepID=A0ABD5XSN9_9EURY
MIGSAVPNVTVSPASLAFGDVPRDGSAMLDVTVGNDGNATLSLDAVSLAGTDDRFSVASSPPATVAPGESTTVAVEFAPTRVGSASETLTVDSSDPDTPSVTVPVTGEATPSETLGTLVVRVENGSGVPFDGVVVDVSDGGAPSTRW